MNDRDICRCHHQRGDHHPLLGLCAHATGTREACVCTAFVLVAGSTSTPKPVVGMDHVADLESRATAAARARLEREYPREDLAGRLTRARRAAVLHPIAQASAAERCQIDANDGTDGTDLLPPACYGCGHPKRAHIYEEGACRPGFVCPCPVYVESPPPDACGRCGHAYSLHHVLTQASDGKIVSSSCHGTGVDTDGNERARACPCGRQGGYVPELPAEEPEWFTNAVGSTDGTDSVVPSWVPRPLAHHTPDPNCMCGHPESEHGLIDGGGHREVCRVRDEDGNLIDGCIEYRPATITHTLANGQVVSHTARDPR